MQAFGDSPAAVPNLLLDSIVEAAHCFAINYTGYLVVKNNSNINFFGSTQDLSLYNRFKVRHISDCVRRCYASVPGTMLSEAMKQHDHGFCSFETRTMPLLPCHLSSLPLQVCLRYNGHAGLTLNGNQIVSAVPTSFDSTLTCVGEQIWSFQPGLQAWSGLLGWLSFCLSVSLCFVFEK